MKRLMMAMLAALMLTTSCTKEESGLSTALTSQDGWRDVTITFDFGDGANTRATLQDASLTDLWVFEDEGDGVRMLLHQTALDDGFGSVSLSLKYGTHALRFVASRGSEPELSEGVLSWAKPSDTFWASVTIDVQPSTSASQSVVLSRVSTRLSISITDEIPANAARLEIEPSAWYYGLDVLTGCVADSRSHVVRSVAIPESYRGTTGLLTATIYGMSPVETWQTDVAVRLVASDETVLGSVSLPGVSLTRNRATVYGGGMMGSGATLSVAVDDDWQDADEHTW